MTTRKLFRRDSKVKETPSLPKQYNPFESPKTDMGEQTFYPSLDEIPDPRSKLSKRTQRKVGKLAEEIVLEPTVLLEGLALEKAELKASTRKICLAKKIRIAAYVGFTGFASAEFILLKMGAFDRYIQPKPIIDPPFQPSLLPLAIGVAALVTVAIIRGLIQLYKNRRGDLLLTAALEICKKLDPQKEDILLQKIKMFFAHEIAGKNEIRHKDTFFRYFYDMFMPERVQLEYLQRQQETLAEIEQLLPAIGNTRQTIQNQLEK